MTVARLLRLAGGVAAAALLLLPSCSGGEGTVTTSCRARLNHLGTAQACYHDLNGRWCDSLEELVATAGEAAESTCPRDGSGYVMELTGDGYRITCPNGHGYVRNGRGSWTGEEGR